MSLEPTTEIDMIDRPTAENLGTDLNEPLYAQAGFEVRPSETLAEKLIELGYAPQTQTHPSAQPSVSEKGKEPEVVNPLLKEQNASRLSELMEKDGTPKEVTNVSCDPTKGKSSIERELEFLKKEMIRIDAQFQTKTDHGYDIKEYIEDESGRGPLEKWHKPAEFDGDGDPMVHLDQYALIAKLNRLPANVMLEWFPTCLQGPALIWYHTLEKNKKASWVELSKAFLEQFSSNIMMNVSLTELRNITQNPDESFSDYLKRWKKKLILVRNKPDEQELIRIFINGTSPPFRDRLCFALLKDFSEVHQMGSKIEDRLLEDQKANVRDNLWSEHGNNVNNCSSSKRKHKGTSRPKNSKLGVRQSVNFVRSGKERRFSNFGEPMSKVLERYIKRGLLQPLEPKPLPNPLPSNFNLQAYCSFHQIQGHNTDKCHRLRHEIQNLIDEGKIPNPDRNDPRRHK